MASRPKEQYFAEDIPQGAMHRHSFYAGAGLPIGIGGILACFLMTALCRSSNNLSFKWLQRRCGWQFGTTAYLMSTNLMYYHDGERWQSKDFSYLWSRAQRKFSPAAAAPRPSAA